MVAWHVGDATGAAGAIRSSVDRGARFRRHVPTIANNLLFKALHEMAARRRRGDAASGPTSLLDVAEKSGLRLYESAALMFLSWAQARLGVADGLARFRGHGETAVNRDAPLFAPLFHGRLAELEAEQTSVGRGAGFDRSSDRIGAHGRHPIHRRPAAPHPRRLLLRRDPRESRPAPRKPTSPPSPSRAAGRAQLRPAGGAEAGEALPIHRPPRRSPRRRSRPRSKGSRRRRRCRRSRKGRRCSPRLLRATHGSPPRRRGSAG